MPSTRSVVRPALLTAFLLAVPTGVMAADQTVEIDNFDYAPKTITLSAGDSITWVNSDTVPHDAVARSETWRTPILQPGGRASVTYDTTGVYAYFCSLHPGMSGTVTVVAATLPATDTETSVPSADPPIWTSLVLIAAIAALAAALARIATVPPCDASS